MKLIDCTIIAQDIFDNLQQKVSNLKNSNIYPKLAIILVGNDYASKIYVDHKIRRCKELGILTSLFEFESNIDMLSVFKTITELNDDNDVHGIIIQIPVKTTKRIANNLVNLINPYKDVDCLHELNLGRFYQGLRIPSFKPCSMLAVEAILNKIGITDLAGKNVVIINDGILIGKPAVAYLLSKQATPIVCHKNTKNIIDFTKLADIIITGVGNRANFALHGDMVKNDAIIIDFGVSRFGERSIKGDCDIDTFRDTNCTITKVPGVGTLVVGMLLKNVVDSAM
jgi:methylenetetrahydrofolate dehydrogenase (NADP+)/methenyltetrahydrofolate cyclohydrolase